MGGWSSSLFSLLIFLKVYSTRIVVSLFSSCVAGIISFWLHYDPNTKGFSCSSHPSLSPFLIIYLSFAAISFVLTVPPLIYHLSPYRVIEVQGGFLSFSSITDDPFFLPSFFNLACVPVPSLLIVSVQSFFFFALHCLISPLVFNLLFYFSPPFQIPLHTW